MHVSSPIKSDIEAASTMKRGEKHLPMCAKEADDDYHDAKSCLIAFFIVFSLLSLFSAIFLLNFYPIQNPASSQNPAHTFHWNGKQWTREKVNRIEVQSSGTPGCVQLDNLEGQSCAFHRVVYHPGGFVPDKAQNSRSQTIHMEHEGVTVAVESLPGQLHMKEKKGAFDSYRHQGYHSYASYDVVVLGTRDWVNVFHLYYEQFWPIHALLLPWDLLNVSRRPITATLMNQFEIEEKDIGYQHESNPNHPLLLLWKQAFNATAVDLIAHANRGFTAKTLIAGNPKMWWGGIDYNNFSPPQHIERYRTSFMAFISWLRVRFNVSYVNPPDYLNRTRTLTAVVISRARTDFRTLINQDDFINRLRAHNITTSLAFFENLTFIQQVKVLTTTDIFVAVHGAAIGQIPWIAPWAVLIELKALGHGGDSKKADSMDFQAGYCNLAKLCMRSLVQWHDRNISNNKPLKGAVKSRNIYMSISDVDLLIQKAMEVVHTHPGKRDYDEERCIRMNEPLNTTGF
jgi:hypothetical protein